MKKHKVVYLGATGGAAALIARCIKKCDVIAYEDLGPEAVRRLEVEDFPLIVVGDSHGGDLYIEGRKQWEQK
jgi:fumarate hydratase subunit beta